MKGGKGERERESSFMYTYIGVSITISKPWFSIQGTMSYTFMYLSLLTTHKLLQYPV